MRLSERTLAGPATRSATRDKHSADRDFRKVGRSASRRPGVARPYYLSYAQLKEYLSILIENGLLHYEEGEHKYKTTEKGIKFMRVYQHMDILSGPLESRT